MNIIPITGSPAPADVAADLRALADLAETEPFIATMIEHLFAHENLWPDHAASYDTPAGAALARAVEKLTEFGTADEPTTDERNPSPTRGFVRQTVQLRALTVRLIDATNRAAS